MIELNKIYNEDCLEGMKRIPDGSVDAIICDLPYEVLHKTNQYAQWDRIIPFEPLWEQYLRVTKKTSPIILFCQGMFTAQLMMSQPKLWRYNLIWNKMRSTGFLNANRMPLRNHEDIAIFYGTLPTYNPQFEDLNGREPSHPQGDGEHTDTNQCYGKVKRIYSCRTTHAGQVYDHCKRVQPTQPDKKFPGSILCFKKEHSKEAWHPTQKPVALIEYLIRTYTNRGGLVLDNCMGSGTTAIACIREHRNFIGFELNKEYFDKANRRIKEELMQPSLFD